MRELQTVSHRELMEPVVEIAQAGVPCGLPGQSQRMERRKHIWSRNAIW